jgi:hypothetical protein
LETTVSDKLQKQQLFATNPGKRKELLKFKDKLKAKEIGFVSTKIQAPAKNCIN